MSAMASCRDTFDHYTHRFSLCGSLQPTACAFQPFAHLSFRVSPQSYLPLWLPPSWRGLSRDPLGIVLNSLTAWAVSPNRFHLRGQCQSFAAHQTGHSQTFNQLTVSLSQCRHPKCICSAAHPRIKSGLFL